MASPSGDDRGTRAAGRRIAIGTISTSSCMRGSSESRRLACAWRSWCSDGRCCRSPIAAGCGWPSSSCSPYLLLLFVKAGLLHVGAGGRLRDRASGARWWRWPGASSAPPGWCSSIWSAIASASPRSCATCRSPIASAVAMVMLLSRSGVNLLSIITTSAVLTAVIGLALQDTLGNLLSGVAMQLESSIAIGDWIRLDERPIGRVLEIRWRSTMIRTKNDDLVIIPNGLFAKGVITIFGKDGLREPSLGLLQRAPAPSAQPGAADRARRARRHAQRLDGDAARLHHLALSRELARVRRALSPRRLRARRSDRLRGAQAHLVRAASREHRDALSGLQRVRDRAVGGARSDQGRARARGGASSCCRRSASWRRSTTARASPSPTGCTTRSTASAR